MREGRGPSSLSSFRQRRTEWGAAIAALALVLCASLAFAQDPPATLPAPQPPLTLGPVLPPPAAAAPKAVLNMAPRSASPFQVKAFQMPSGEQVIVVSGGVLLTVRNVQGVGMIDIEAEQMVFWTRGDSNNTLGRMQSTEGLPSEEQEFYLSGDVQIRNRSNGQDRRLRAEQVYYDIKRNVAVAASADLELRDPKIPEPLHMKAVEIIQLSPKKWEAQQAQIFSSRLPSDPGLAIDVRHATIEDKQIERTGWFGQPILDAQGSVEMREQRLVRGESVFLELESFPIFYLPWVQGDASEPLGPLQNLAFRQDKIFGTQILTTFNMWSILNRDPLPGTKWTLQADYLSKRGPALGTDYQYSGKDLFGTTGPYVGEAKLYGIHDVGTDILGGGRGEFEHHTEWRGRVLWRHQQEFADNFLFQGQLSALSDKNFLEQYYKQEFDTDINQETFAYLKYQRGIFAATALAEANIRPWVTETQWLPRIDANALGVSFFDLFTYNVRANAGYAIFHPTSVPPPPIYSTDMQNKDLGRFDINQELSLPFYLGPIRVVPYGTLDLTEYTEDLAGSNAGRFIGGGGVRSSIPFSRVYPDANSDLFNLCGINHKIMVSSNYYVAHSDKSFTLFPQLDRLNDDATDQALRDITPIQPAINPDHGVALATSPLFNPQLYAIRRLVDNRVDTLDSIEVFQGDIRQRWQTKRGYPGQQHVVDFLTLDVSGSFYPHPGRDNFGESVAFLEYDATWNVGDRTAIVSSGLFDPFDEGARVFTIGAYLNRTDRTNFFVGYRSIDPLESRALTAAVTYIFSPKYAITGSATYDFGTNQSLSNSVVVSRMGSDLTLSVGVNYNAITNNFGFTLELIPNLLVAGSTRVTPSPFGTALFR